MVPASGPRVVVWSTCTASYCFLSDFSSKETRPREVKRFWSRHLKRWRTTKKPCVNSPLPLTTRGGCSSVPRTKPVVSAWSWLELPGLRLTNPAETLLTRLMHRGRKGSTQSRATTILGSTGQVPGLGLSGLACEASSTARRRVSRVAVRACRRQWPPEA